MASPKDSSSDRRKGLYSSKSCLSVPASADRAPLTQLFVPADDPWPTLPHAGAARVPGLSTAQNEACALAHESHVRASGMTLRLARLLIGMLGIPSRCERPCCNRAAACTGERRGREWCFYPGPAWPPCVHSAGRVDILRPTVERLIDRLDALFEAPLTARLGELWAAVDHIGLTHLPAEEVHAALFAMFEEGKRARKRFRGRRRVSGGAYGEWHAYGRETFARATICGRVRRTIGAVSGANRREIRKMVPGAESNFKISL